MANPKVAAPETIGQRLRRLRTDRGFSQRELSSPGVSYAYISRIEAGTRQPSVKALRMLARKLGVSADYLETGSDLAADEARELRLADAELKIRLGEDAEGADDELSTVLEEATAAGDVAAATRARIGLGLAAAARSDYRTAIERLDEALRAKPLRPNERPDVFATLGRAYAALGRPLDAVELFERCIDEIRESAPDDLAARVRFATYLTYALSDMGELGRAEQVMKDALDQASDLDDPYTRVRIYWSLARLAELDGNALAALDYVRRAIALLETTEDTLHLARAHLLCAWIVGSNGDADETGRHLATAERLLGPTPQRDDLGTLRIEQARRAVLVGDGRDAVEKGREAIELLGENHAGEQGTAWTVVADGLELSGDTDAASDAYRTAVDLLAEHSRWREAAQAARSWAKALRATGRESEALDVLERATDLAVRGDAVEVRRKA